VVFALFEVLSGSTAAKGQGKGSGAMSREQVAQFDEASIVGAPLSASLLHGGGGNQAAVTILTVVMILTMTAAQFITQKDIMAKSMPEEAVASPYMRQQKMRSISCRSCSVRAASSSPSAC